MSGWLFNLPAVTRAVGFALVAVAIVATAIRINRHEPSLRLPRMVVVAPRTDPLTREITRCEALGMAAERDARCNAAWGENRQRFFTYRRSADSDSRATHPLDQPTPNPKDR